MASLVRHPSGDTSAGCLPPRRHTLSTLVSAVGIHPGDRSFLLIRERPGEMPSGEHLVLCGDFDHVMQARLLSLLSSLPAGSKPLVFDLRRVTFLDDACLGLLLKAQRDYSAVRSVVFQIAATGSVRRIITRLGLEKRLGLAPLPLPGATLSERDLALHSLLADVTTKPRAVRQGAASHV